MNMMSDPAASTTIRQVWSEVLVVGGGGSGLAAAIEAASLGRSVNLLEKNAKLGGSTGRSVGSVTVSNSPHQLRDGVHDCPEHHLEDLGKINAKLNLPTNVELSRLLVENVTDTFRWLLDSGVEFFGPLPEPPHRKPRLHQVLPNSRAFIYHLGKRARKLGVGIHTNIRAREAIVENGAVVGMRCDTDDGPVEFRAHGTVLATGDFGGNPDMVHRYIPAMAGVEPINPHNTGDGHLVALSLGGEIVHPQLHQGGIRFQAPPERWITSLPPWRIVSRAMRLAMKYVPSWLLRPFLMSFLTSILVPDPKLYREGCILINKEGRRFADELGMPAPGLSQQPEQYGYILMDGNLAEKFSAWPYFISTAPGVAYAFVADYRRSRKDIFNEGRSLAELAGRLGMVPETLERTIADYNAGSERGGRPALESGPYVALGPVRHMIQFTDSGVAVNGRLEVLGEGGEPVPGLFAAGFTGMGGALLWGHGHHLGWAFTSGRIAGRQAAYRALTADLPAQHH
ncbi:MAG TPA: FAD-dependent oxidoreductase [Stellaceae bacterium]|nr:FAD-dependent oxidoreductase [Stellaceae bacterium]